MMHIEEDFLLVDKEVAEESGREELQGANLPMTEV